MINQARQGSLPALLNHDPEEIGKCLQRGASRIALQQYRWFQNLPDGSRPPGVPLLLFNRMTGKGELGWMNVVSGTADAARLPGDLYQAADRALQALSAFHGHYYGRPGIHCQISPDLTKDEIEGTSGTLAVLLDWLFSVLKIEPENNVRCELGRLTATGSWSFESGQFDPVPSSTLKAKAEAAIRWGYRTLILVENQDLPPDFPNDEVRILRVPCQPVEAVFTILEQPECVSILQKNALRAETVLNSIRGVWINDPEKRVNAAPRLIEALHEHALENSNPTLQALTGDLLLREAFYLDNPDQISLYWASTSSNLLNECRFLDSQTCTYFRHEQKAMIAKHLIDQGYWKSSAEHAEYSVVLDFVLSHADRNAAQPWDVPTHFGIFALNNILSHRELFSSRLHDDEFKALELISACLDRRLLYHDMWNHFWDSHGHRKDTYPERQINQLVEVWWELRRFSGTSFSEKAQPIIDMIQEAIANLESQIRHLPSREPNYWDNLGRWTHAFLTGSESEIETRKKICVENVTEWKSNPSAKPLSPQDTNRKILERTLLTGKDPEAWHALRDITKGDKNAANETAIYRLLRLRSEAIVISTETESAITITGNLEKKMSDAPQSRADKSENKLPGVFAEIFNSESFEEFIRKCPY